ncbi:MAG TPA: hypothetical protein VGF00_15030 [Acidimicrobiia bacterium]
MSRPTRRRGVFDPAALGDLDELLPASPGTGTPTAPPPAAPTSPPAAPAARVAPDQPAVKAAETRPTTPPRRTRAAAEDRGSGRNRTAPAEVALAPDVYQALRELTLRERAATPTTARSYGRVALDAVEAHATELARHWAAPARATGSLFSRGTDVARRRRHAQAPARVPLAGVVARDVDQLDKLATDWGAGSRSALVETALRLYLDVKPPSDR